MSSLGGTTPLTSSLKLARVLTGRLSALSVVKVPLMVGVGRDGAHRVAVDTDILLDPANIERFAI